MKLNDENKQVKEFTGGNWFNYGVHEVTISAIGLGHTDDDKEYVEVEVLGSNEEQETARVWFTSDKAANYSFNVLRQIYVHNAPAAKKDVARDTIDAVKDTAELVDRLQEKLLGGQCWFSKYPDPTRTYQAADGTTKQSINKNIYGYEPKPRPELIPQESTVQQTFPGATKADSETSGGIPQEWA